jgi:CHRD domain
MRTGAKRVMGLALAIGALAGGGVASANDGSVRLTANLTGAQEVPPADPDGSAKAKVDINVDAGEVCFDIKIDATGTPNRAHIHVGDAGVNGGIVVPFFELREVPTDPRNDEIEMGRIEECVAADPVVLAAIVANPSGYYVNLHNSRFPAGAIRCQLED